MDQLILKYLQGKLSLQEQHQLAKWLDEHDANREILKRMEIFWKDHRSDLDERELKVRFQLSERIKKAKNNQQIQHSIPSRIVIRWAAILLLGLSTVFYAYQWQRRSILVSEPISYIQKSSMAGQKLTFTLPDGSKVKLNANSTLIVPERFEGHERMVELEGEAFFEIKRDPSHPFIVKTNQMNVTVLGTSFDIRSYEDEPVTSVAVATGKVAVTEPTGKLIDELTPNEMVTYDVNVKEYSIQTVDQRKVFGWKDDWLVFEKEDFATIIPQLERWYGVTIKIADAGKITGKFSGQFHNNSLEKVLEGLAYVYYFDFSIKDKTVTLNPIANENNSIK